MTACEAITVAAVASTMSDRQQPAGRHQVERVGDRARILQQQRALAEVVQHQRGQHDHEPAAPDRRAAEVTHVGIQRLAAGHGEEDRREHDESGPAVVREELHRVQRIDREHDIGLGDDPAHAEQRKRDEPDERDRTEHPAHRAGAASLHEEQRGQDEHRPGQHEVLQPRRRDGETFHRAEHGDRGSDEAVAEEQRGAEHADGAHRCPHAPVAAGARQQGTQREHAAFAAIVGAQHDGDVLDRDDQDQRPEDQRQQADDVLLR